MSARSRQAQQLSWHLRNDLDVQHLQLAWSGQPRTGSFGGWRLEWTDGPSLAQMRDEVARRANRFPAIPFAELAYDRNLSDLGEAIAVLRYLDQDGDDGPRYGLGPGLLSLARQHDISYPERVGAPWRARAYALLSISSSHSMSTGDAIERLSAEARQDWPHVLAWLDGLADTEITNVLDFPGPTHGPV